MQFFRNSSSLIRFGALLVCHVSWASGVVSTCDDAGLRAAVEGGGIVVFGCDGTVLLTNFIQITSDTTLDASGHNVTLSGGDATRLFTVAPGIKLVLQNLTLADGLALGTNGGAGIDGGPGQGGAIYSYAGTVSALNCSFLRNRAVGGAGGTGGTTGPYNGSGGLGTGGAVFGIYGYLNFTNCSFIWNSSLGGTGAVAQSVRSVLSGGGDAQGGAITTIGGTLALANCSMSGNQAQGGPGRKYSLIGAYQGGAGYGGALYSSTGEVWLVHSKVVTNATVAATLAPSFGGAVYQTGGNVRLAESWLQSNTSLGGAGLPGYGGGIGAPSGPSMGGSIYTATGFTWVTNSTISGNLALGGPGYYLNYPGSSSGGAFFNSGSLIIANSTICKNTSRGGLAGFYNAPDASAFGGAIYNNGSLSLTYVTLCGNSAERTTNGVLGSSTQLGGALFSTNGTAGVHATIIANSLSGSNAYAILLDQGYNLSSDASCNFSAQGSLNNVDPKLGPLDWYGGPTPTVPLLSASPAIDAGDSSACLPTDQRGHTRPFGLTCDIGAFESSPPFTIRGFISGNTLGEEISIAIGSSNVLTSNHYYIVDGLSAGGYTLTPLNSKYLFLPPAISGTLGPDRLGADFRAYQWNTLSLDALSNGVPEFVFAGTNGQTWRTLASSNLANWIPISTNLIGPSNYFELFDVSAPGHPFRVYKTSLP